jgi:putative inorganic carbon (HCO3(-)) transporter
MTWVTPLVLFVLYVNAPAVAVRIHGAPFLLGALVPLALVIPVAHRVLVRGESIRFPNMLVAAVVMLLLHAISALISARPYEAIDILQTWLTEGVLLALLVANAIRTRAELQSAAFAIVAAGAVMGALAITQQILGAADHTFFGFGQLDSAISDTGGNLQRRLAGPIGETNRFAQIMAVLIPISAGCAATSIGRTRIILWVATALICGGMVFAFSRGAIVALAIALPFALGFRMLRLRHLILTIVAAICVLAAVPHYAERVASIGEVAARTLGIGPSGLRNADGASRGRMTEMKAASMLFLDHPILGAGPGLAPHYYNHYASLVGGKVRPDARRTHNLFLQLAAETGIVGLGAFAFVIGLAFQGIDRARRQLEKTDRPMWGVICGLELALVISLASSLFLHAAYIRYFWLLLGLTAAATAHQGPPVLATLLERMLRQTAERIRASA